MGLFASSEARNGGMIIRLVCSAHPTNGSSCLVKALRGRRMPWRRLEIATACNAGLAMTERGWLVTRAGGERLPEPFGLRNDVGVAKEG